MEQTPRYKCAHPKVERRSRVGLLDSLMYRLGRYPWTCQLCGRRLYYKDRRPGERGGSVRNPEGLPLA